MERIDAALAAGAQAELQSPGRRGMNSVDLVTFRAPDGRIVDQFPVSGHVASTAQFVSSYNRKLATMPPPAPAAPPPDYPQQQGYPPPSSRRAGLASHHSGPGNGRSARARFGRLARFPVQVGAGRTSTSASSTRRLRPQG